MKPHRGALILVFGILGLVMCGIFTALPAWIMGNRNLKEIDGGTMDPTGRGLTSAGRILGIIGSILFLVGIVIGIAVMLLGLLGAMGRPG